MHVEKDGRKYDRFTLAVGVTMADGNGQEKIVLVIMTMILGDHDDDVT